MPEDHERLNEETPGEEERQARTATGLAGCLVYPGIIMVALVVLALLYLAFFRTGG